MLLMIGMVKHAVPVFQSLQSDCAFALVVVLVVVVVVVVAVFETMHEYRSVFRLDLVLHYDTHARRCCAYLHYYLCCHRCGCEC